MLQGNRYWFVKILDIIASRMLESQKTVGNSDESYGRDDSPKRISI